MFAPALLHGQAPAVTPLKKLSSLSLLPPGSELNNVMLPRYDESQRLIGVLKAAKMTLVDDQTISGNTIRIEFSNPQGGVRGLVDLKMAVFHQATGTLEARESVTLRSDRLNATGSGLIYRLEQAEGFLTGPAVTWIPAPPTTTMNHSSLRNIVSGAAAMAILPHSLVAAPPPPISADEKSALKADAAPLAPAHSQAMLALDAGLIEDLDAAAAANRKVRGFLTENSQANTNASGEPDKEAPPAPAEPNLEPGPDDTVIRCEGGMYFDPDEGVFVFLRNVRVTDPRLILTGADELKIFLAKKSDGTPATDPAKPDQTGGNPFGAKLGDVERIVATGNIHMAQQKSAEVTEPAEASGAIFTYNLQTGNATLSGGKLWGRRGQIALRARQPDLTLRVEKTGRLVTEGDWETIIVNEKKR